MATTEICLSSDDLSLLKKNVTTVYQAGAHRIELCSSMEHDGLTPSSEAIAIARQYFCCRKGLLVMIRPRPGNFCYNTAEIDLMLKQMEQAAKAGADGVVFGGLTTHGKLDIPMMKLLLELNQTLKLTTTFHRAFDVFEQPIQALDSLIHLGINRVLTSGVEWGIKATAFEGLESLKLLVKHASNNIEVVVGGGVNQANALFIQQALDKYEGNTSLHAYSAVLKNKIVQEERVKVFVDL